MRNTDTSSAVAVKAAPAKPQGEAPIVCVGASHTNSVAAAAEAAAAPLTLFRIRSGNGTLEKTKADGWILSRQVTDAVRETGVAFSMLGGNAHNVLGLLEHPRPFDFVLAQAPDLPLDEEKDVVPFDCMRSVLAGMMEEPTSLLRQLAATGAVIHHLESPPPPADERFVMRSLDKYFRQQEAERGEPPRIAARFLRLKLWRLHSDIMKKTCKKLGVNFVRAPRAAIDPKGFLKRPYWYNATHANEAYGALLLEQMRTLRG